MSSTTISSEEAAFLAALNHQLPQNVDWTQGALDYIAMRLAEKDGDLVRRFHLTKPFYSVYPIETPINLQLREFVREVSHFLNILSLLNIDSQAQFLDVACGSGWVLQFLAKLNLHVTGIDISPDMLALTEERLRLDPLPTVESAQFNQVKLLVHNMEKGPLQTGTTYDIAILESALHHFINPIQTLRNIAESLNDQGIIIILEAASSDRGNEVCIEVMEQYNTLERPYTREQMVSILQFAGFPEFQFLHPINGFFQQSDGVAKALSHELQHCQNWNIVVATKQQGVLADRLQLQPVGQVGIKGEIQTLLSTSKTLLSTSKRLLKKTVAKLGI